MIRDPRALFIMLLFMLCGWTLALTSFALVGDNRAPTVARGLALTVVATPLGTLFGWLISRRSEWRLALACCGAVYFFTPFVAARIETILAPEAARQTVGQHTVYFVSVLALHLMCGLGLIWWRSRQPVTSAVQDERIVTRRR